MDDEPDAAGVVLESGVVQTLGGRQSFLLHTRFIGYEPSIAKRNLQMPSMRSGSNGGMRGAHGMHAPEGTEEPEATESTARANTEERG
jgi:hypothetical protein